MQPSAHFGGAERQAATIAPLLGEHGVEVLPVVGPGDEIVEWLRERGVRDYVHSRAFPDLPSGSRLRTIADHARCMRQMREELASLLRERDVDIVLAAMAFSWVAATQVARAFAVPIVWRAGGTECSRIERTMLAGWARWNPPDRLVCNGHAVQRMFAPLVGSQSVVIRNGIDLRQFDPAAITQGFPRPAGARIVIGFAGRLAAQKRPDDFIRVAARFADRDDVVFVLAGDGTRRGHCERLARELGARTLQMTGYVRDMRAFHAACDVLVLPSRSEGCPNVVLEAMAMKAAVVAANAPATAELVSDGVDGLLYPIGELDALEARLRALIDRDDLRRRLVARGLGRVEQLSAHACAARTAALLRETAREGLAPVSPAPARHMVLRASRST